MPNEFFERIKGDMTKVTDKKNGPTHYFMSKSIPVGKNSVKRALENIVATAEILTDRYDKLNKCGGLLKATNWPQNTANCFYYNSICPFGMVCRYGGDPTTFMAGFKQREMLYEQEKLELAT